MRTLRWLRSSVDNLVSSLPQRRRRLVQEMVLGMLAAGSVVLSEIARQLHPDGEGFKACLNRLSRGIGSATDAVQATLTAYLQRVGRLTDGAFDVIAVDHSEIVKRYGRKMEFLCQVRDASEGRRGKFVIEQGWWLVEIVATSANHRVLPLLRTPYSSTHPAFLSANEEVLAGIRRVLPFVSRSAVWVFDRGFDGARFMAHLRTLVERWIIRERGDRHIFLAGDREAFPTRDIANNLDLRYVAQPLISVKNRLRRVAREFGYCTVQLEVGGPMYTLLAVVHPKADSSAARLILLSSIRVKNPRQARKLVESYYRRWAVEEQIRADKQLQSLENVRVLRYTALENLLTLTTIATGMLAYMHVVRARHANNLVRRAPIVSPIPPFPLYRLHCMVCSMLRTAFGRRAWRDLRPA